MEAWISRTPKTETAGERAGACYSRVVIVFKVVRPAYAALLLYGSDGQERAVAALVVLKLPHLEIIYEGYQELIPTVPYAAGFLGFREVPAYIGLFDQVPDSLKPQASHI